MLKRAGGSRPWVISGLVCLLVVFGTVSFVRRVTSRVPEVGADWVQGPGGPVVAAVEPESPAQAAGLLRGDRLERVNGAEVASVLDAASVAWGLRANGTVLVDVDRGGTRLTLEIRPAARVEVPPLYGFLGLVAVAFLASGVFVALRWPTVRGGTAYAVFCGLLFAHLVLSHTGRADALDWAVYGADVAAGALAPAVLIHLVYVLSRRTVTGRRVGLGLAYVTAAGIVAAAGWLVAFGGALRLRNPVAAVEGIDRAEVGFLGVAAPLAAWLLFQAYRRTASPLHRSQLRWMLWGVAIGLLPFVAIYVLPWAAGAGVPEWADLAVFPMLVVPGAFTVAFARYRLNDLDTLLRRMLAEAASAFLTLAAYAAAAEFLHRAAGGVLPLSWSGVRYLAILLAAVSYPTIRLWVRKGVDLAFYRSRYSYRATLLDWARELSAETHLETLLDRLRGRLRETLGVPDARVLVRGEGDVFEVAGAEDGPSTVVLPRGHLETLGSGHHVVLEERELAELPWARHLVAMKVKGRLRAVLAVADREDPEEPFSSEDRSLLATLAAHAATAIEAARLVREVRKHAEHVERLKASQERILESSGVGLLLMDDDGTILAWNRTLEAMYALSRAEAIGRRIDEVFPLHAVRRVQREIARLPDKSEARIYRYNLVNRAGRRIVVNLTISPPGGSGEGAAGRVVTFDDVTDQVKLEEQVLRQERLASLGLLAAGVAHEVNTPLTGISSYTQMLLEEMLPDDPRRAILEKIEAQSRRASSIANSLLNFARPERSAYEELSLNDTVTEVLRLFEPKIRERGIRLETSLAADLPPIHGHKGKVQQVLLNLLLNARDAVEEGGRVSVTTEVREGAVALQVVDDGVGIAEEDLPRIFDPFFTTKGRGRGTGLGLSISYGIVREHEGELSVESVPGEWTRFRVEFPLARPAEALA
ncbi:MAG: PAS domain S-box protein [Acidobacteriia bacterium]|nr:PAS domain S-box protein [Terriglobia bacterium]